MDISKKIKRCLLYHDMKQADLCTKTKIASGNLCNMLKRNTFKTQELEKIADAMGYELEINFVDKHNNIVV